MKFRSLTVAVAAACATAVPTYAQTVHETTVSHEGRTLTVRYEPQVETQLRDVGNGPRSSPSCRWTSVLSVRRTTLDPQQRPIAALTRLVEMGKQRSGTRLGACASHSRHQFDAFSNSQGVRGHLSRIARRDAANVRAEFASLGAVHPSATHAR